MEVSRQIEAPAALTPGKNLGTDWIWGLGGGRGELQSRSRLRGRKKNLLRSLIRAARATIAAPTTLLRYCTSGHITSPTSDLKGLALHVAKQQHLHVLFFNLTH